MISLEKEPYTDEMYDQLYRALRKNAVVTEVLHTRTANKALSATPRPSAVLVSNAAITRPKHAALLARLIEYARGGGRVVLGMQLSNHFRLDAVGAFFRQWGLEWDWGSYHRTTFGLNPAGVPAPLDASALFPSVSMKALHVKNAPRECAVYRPTPASRLESMVYASAPITGDKADESPAVFVRVGDGYLGYIGDVNAEQGSLRLTLEMCAVKHQPGDLGATNRSTGIVLHRDGRREVDERLEEEVPLPSAAASTSTSSTSSPVPSSTCAAASSVGSSSGPALVPTTLLASAPSFVPAPHAPARPREAEVLARAERLATVREEKTKRANALKEEGNALFRGQEDKWAEAAEKYRSAALIAGPQPVYLSNLAAALLKIKRWTLAESAASRALMREPEHAKALFRRAQARKEQGRFRAAEADLRRVLAKDRANAAALAEMEAIRALKRTTRSRDLPEDDESCEDVPDLEEESDSEDYKHKGNGTPCRFYNRSGCTHGTRCRFAHAPDRKSVRDELGRNACVYWLLDECRFGDEKCQYAHDRAYLPARGWWTDEGRNARLRSAMHATFDVVPRHYFPKALLAEAAKPDPWREDLWATGKYTDAPAGAKKKKKGGKKNKGRGNGAGHSWYGGGYGAGPSGYGGYGYEYDEEDMHERHMEDFYEEMMLQGIKPWEVDSMDELAAIHGALYDGY